MTSDVHHAVAMGTLASIHKMSPLTSMQFAIPYSGGGMARTFLDERSSLTRKILDPN